jgi:drug/metabolite transporter (DMT)-like permease
VPTAALLLALAAAGLHAFWNLIIARARDAEAATALVLVLSVAMYAPVAAFTWDVEASVWPYALASTILELAYVILLAAAYRRADLSVVYPVARGVAPVLVLVAGLAILGTSTSAAEVGGVLLVAAGVLVVRGLRVEAGPGVPMGFAIACTIAAYTLVDSRGIRHADPFGYLELVMTGPALVYLAGVTARKGVAPVRAALSVATVLAAAASLGAYALALAALEIASAASVAAVRETSIVVAVALAAPVLREKVGARRLLGAVVVASGVALLSW